MISMEDFIMMETHKVVLLLIPSNLEYQEYFLEMLESWNENIYAYKSGSTSHKPVGLES